MQLQKTTTQFARCTACFLFASLLLVAADQATAQNSFKTGISSSELLLESPNDPMVQKIVMWDSPLMREIARSRPFFEVTNTSTTNNLTSISITIGDTDFNFSDDFFGEFAVLGTTTPNATLASATTTNNGDVLVVDFGAGLAPQETIRFQFDLDPDPGTNGYINPDYRTVLFDLFDNDDTDNSVVTAMFSAGGDLQFTFQDDANPPTPVFTNGNIRPYDTQEPTDIYDPPIVTIPEPSTMLLTLLGLAGASAAAMRRRLG